jgi:hypothetical protein
MIREANHFIYIGTLSLVWDGAYVNLNIPCREPVLVSWVIFLLFLKDLIWASSISNTKESGPVKNQIAAALVERIVSAARSGTKFKAGIGCHIESVSDTCTFVYRSSWSFQRFLRLQAT